MSAVQKAEQNPAPPAPMAVNTAKLEGLLETIQLTASTGAQEAGGGARKALAPVDAARDAAPAAAAPPASIGGAFDRIRAGLKPGGGAKGAATAQLGVAAPIPVPAPPRPAVLSRFRRRVSSGLGAATDAEVLPLGRESRVSGPAPQGEAAPPGAPQRSIVPAGGLAAPPIRPRSAREGRVYFDKRAFCVEPMAAQAIVHAELDALSQLHTVVRKLAAGLADREYAMGGDILAGHRQPTPLDWRAAKAPSLAEFEAIAAEAFDALPDAFKQHCQGVAILIRDYPERDQLAAVGLKNELDLLGLYEGVDLTQASGFDAPQDLTRIYLFRRPLLDYWAEHDETLGGLITHVLVHEIGHHFGLSDAQMQAIEDAAG